jgi:hypothetical protein
MTGWELNFGHFHLGGIPCGMDGFDTWVPRWLSYSSSQRSGRWCPSKFSFASSSRCNGSDSGKISICTHSLKTQRLTDFGCNPKSNVPASRPIPSHAIPCHPIPFPASRVSKFDVTTQTNGSVDHLLKRHSECDSAVETELIDEPKSLTGALSNDTSPRST